jgi:hypothetical protein
MEEGTLGGYVERLGEKRKAYKVFMEDPELIKTIGITSRSWKMKLK